MLRAIQAGGNVNQEQMVRMLMQQQQQQQQGQQPQKVLAQPLPAYLSALAAVFSWHCCKPGSWVAADKKDAILGPLFH